MYLHVTFESSNSRDICFYILTLSFALQLSSGWDQPMGSLVVPMKNLLAEPQLVLDQWFHLDGASPESHILLRAELKVPDTFFVLNSCVSITVFAQN